MECEEREFFGTGKTDLVDDALLGPRIVRFGALLWHISRLHLSLIRCTGQSLADIPFEELRLRCGLAQALSPDAMSFPLFVIVCKLRRGLKDGFLNPCNPGMFFPRIVWVQDGAKISGFELKLNLFRLLVEKLKAFNLLPVPTAKKEASVCLQRLTELETFCCDVQTKCKSNFDSAEPIKKKVLPRSSFQKFVNTVVTFAKTGAQQVSQIMKQHLSASDLTNYTQCLLELFNELHNDDATKTSLSSFFVNLKMLGHGDAVAPVESFFRLVVCKLIAKDIAFLVSRYIRKTTQSFLSIHT